MRILRYIYEYALAVLVVRDDERITAEHYAVAATERLWYIITDVNFDLKRDIRLVLKTHSPL